MLFLDLKILISDILAAGKGLKAFTRDFIGAGPRTVAGILKNRGIESKISLFNDANSKKMEEFDILMISAMSMDAQACKTVIKKWRSVKKGVNKPVILGGPIASGSERFLRKIDFDLALIGEGELIINELINNNILADFQYNHDKLNIID